MVTDSERRHTVIFFARQRSHAMWLFARRPRRRSSEGGLAGRFSLPSAGRMGLYLWLWLIAKEAGVCVGFVPVMGVLRCSVVEARGSLLTLLWFRQWRSLLHVHMYLLSHTYLPTHSLGILMSVKGSICGLGLLGVNSGVLGGPMEMPDDTNKHLVGW